MHQKLNTNNQPSVGVFFYPWIWNLSFIVFVLLIVAVRVQVFFQFNTQVIDSDQPYMWLGAHDYAKGLFMEPRYYGQDYNTFMEALFAVPLIWQEVPVYKALPVASDVISLFPFLFAAFYLFFKGLKVQAMMALSVVLCLPVSYDMICSMPRGFVTGLFFCSFFIVSLIHPQNKRWMSLNTVLAVLAYFVSPNSLVLSLPFLFYLFLVHYRNQQYYVVTTLSLAIPFAVLYYVFDRFYKLHPDYVMNDLTLRFSTDYFPMAIAAFSKFFKQLCFFQEANTYILFAVLIGATLLLYKRNNKFVYAMLVFFAFLFFSFCFGKTQDGSEWLFMPRSRMYLGIPLLIVLALSQISLNVPRSAMFLLLVPLAYGGFKLTDIEKTFARNEPLAQWTGVRLVKVEDALRMTTFYKEQCVANKADFLLVSNQFWMNTLLVYGGPAVFADYPETQEAYRDKRYWARKNNSERVVPRLVLVSSNFNLDKDMPQGRRLRIKRLDDYGMFLIENNTYVTRNLCHLISAYEN